jgi:ParB-like chromosome segregation protein Spo0J
MTATSLAPNIEIWPLDRLRHYARNPRKNDHAIDQMVASISEFGFKIPVLAKSDGSLIDGHLRLKAAKKAGITEVPVILCDEWTDAQVKAFRLLVNRSGTWADWDHDLLALEIEELKLEDFDLSLTGFDASEIGKLISSETNQVPEPPSGFKEYDENIATEHECPQCGYKWSGGK